MPSPAVFADRIHAAIEAGIIDVMWADSDQGQVCVTAGELAVLLCVLLPEEYPQVADPERPTSAPPGSPRKVDELRQRMEAGVGLWRDDDADMHKAKGQFQRGGSARGSKKHDVFIAISEAEE